MAPQFLGLNWRNLKMWLLAVAAILNLMLWGLAYQNRASEKIVTALIVSLLGALATSTAVMVFSSAPYVSEQFATSLPVSVDQHALRLISILSLDEQSLHAVHIFKKANEAIATLQKRNHSLFSIPHDVFGQTLFHHLLQRAVLERMAYTFGGSWRIERLGWLDTPHGAAWQPTPEPPGESTVIRAEDFSGYLRGNQFADLQLNLGGLLELVLPPKTKLTVEPPTQFPAVRSAIHLENPFCSVVIEIDSLGAGSGLGSFAQFGQLGEWLPSTDVQAPASMYSLGPVGDFVGVVSYKISATASFSAWRSGHPEMPAYKTWVNELFASLRDEWDNKVIMRKAIERVRDEQILGGHSSR